MTMLYTYLHRFSSFGWLALCLLVHTRCMHRGQVHGMMDGKPLSAQTSTEDFLHREGMGEKDQERLTKALFAWIHKEIPEEEKLCAINHLIQAGADVCGVYWDSTPLRSALEQGQIAVIQLLMDNADVHRKDQYGCTPLHRAASHGLVTAMESLIHRHADVHATDNYGDTPLFKAVKSGNADAVALLIDNQAEVCATNIGGCPPLPIAVWHGNLAAIELLLAHGGEVNRQDPKKGNTPLHNAIADRVWTFDPDSGEPYCYVKDMENLKAMVALLLEKGADVTLKNAAGKTPLDLAKAETKEDFGDIIRLLLGA